MASLRPLSWSFTRGPGEPPCASGRRLFSSCHVGRLAVAMRSSAKQPASTMAYTSSLPATSQAQLPPNGSDDGRRKPRIVVYEEDFEEEDAMEYARRDKSQVKKLNADLALWRARNARISANLTLDPSEKRALLTQSEDALRRVIAMDPSDGRAYVVLGRIMLKQRRFEEARQLYSEGCYNTGNANPYIWAAWGYLEARCGKPDIARKMYDAAVCVDPAHACAWHKWGMLEKAEGNYTRARDRWLQGIQNCRKTAQKSVVYLYQSLAVMAAELGKVDQARAWFEEGTRTAFGPSSVALWQAWAVMEARQGDKSAVRYLFKRALQAEPRSRYVHLAWAMWEQEQGNMRQCLALLRRGQQFNPTDPALYQAWAVLEKQTGNVDRARQLFEAGLRANKSHLPLWQAWGVMEFEIGNVDRARELFQQGVWADAGSKDCAYAFHAWGVLERSAGNHGLARELFKSALKVDPKNETVWATWTLMEDELGNATRADELRIRRAERQWEFDVPAGFSTRPQDASSTIATIMGSLAAFFKQRGSGGGAGGGAGAGSSDGEGAAAGAAGSSGMAAPARAAPIGSRPLRQILPDVQDDLQVEDILKEVAVPSSSSSTAAPRPRLPRRPSASADSAASGDDASTSSSAGGAAAAAVAAAARRALTAVAKSEPMAGARPAALEAGISELSSAQSSSDIASDSLLRRPGSRPRGSSSRAVTGRVLRTVRDEPDSGALNDFDEPSAGGAPSDN